MARALTPQDAHALITAMYRQATGQDDISVVDTSSFISAGELILQTGMENVFNAINIVLGRLIVTSRPYIGKFRNITAENADIYTSRIRKVSFYSKGADPAGNFNTNLFTNFSDGYTSGENGPNAGGTGNNSTKSQWEQHPPMPLEMSFGGMSVWQECITLYEDAVKYAFRSEDEFNRFVAGYLQEHSNDIESRKEAWNRAGMLNKIAATLSYGRAEQCINLTAAYNAEFGTSYTSAQLRTDYLKEFLQFFTALFKTTSEFLTDRTNQYHESVPKTVGGTQYEILRHTPYNRQRVWLYSPLYTKAEAMVLPEIFRPGYLDLDTQFEPVTYWQGVSDRAAISVTPAITDLTSGSPTYGQQIAGSNISVDYVVGVLMDEDALMSSFYLDRVDTTPLEARKHYRNTWLSIARNLCDDPTENCVVFYMEDV